MRHSAYAMGPALVKVVDNVRGIHIHKKLITLGAVLDSLKKGEELGYDYQIGRDKNDPPNVDEIYACRCGAPKCRGTMLWPAKRPKPKKKKKVAKKAAKKAGKKAGKKAAKKAGKKAGKKAKKAAKKRSAR